MRKSLRRNKENYDIFGSLCIDVINFNVSIYFTMIRFSNLRELAVVESHCSHYDLIKLCATYTFHAVTEIVDNIVQSSQLGPTHQYNIFNLYTRSRLLRILHCIHR
jgi:hypothetical protein